MLTLIGDWVIPIDGTSLPDKSVIGGKAWSIARMRRLGLSVPPAFVITTVACKAYFERGGLTEELEQQIDAGVKWLEQVSGRRLGAGPSPLLVSVRSGAPISMPGMMDTVLNLGITAETEKLLAEECGSPHFAHDTHRRFLDLYASVVMKAPSLELSGQGDPEQWHGAIRTATGKDVPENVSEQLRATVVAVFDSWNSRRAKRYRAHHGIAEDLGTAVTVQAMVFGNRDERSGTGVLFSRNPLTGERKPYGEYLPRAQGEDIVSGKHTPQPLSAMQRDNPAALEELLRAAEQLEQTECDVQDIEFTIESGKLYLLQTRTAKRAPHAAARIAADMAIEGLIEPAEALTRISPEQIRTMLRPRLAEDAATSAHVLATGESASPGVGYGIVVADPDEAERRAQAGEQVVLARVTTSPNDLHGMIAACAILTEQGGSTSHAAVVGRALGKPCVVGCGAGTVEAIVGQWVTVDGQAGTIFEGRLAVVAPDEEHDPVLRQLIYWARERTLVKVEAAGNADTPATPFDQIDIGNRSELAAAFEALKPGATVSGAIFAENDEAVRNAIAAGASTIVTRPQLPALLAAVSAAPR
ncbi:pyruvate, phosphate dikinase [Croceicoccus ponticola]|uniref:Pyruvate, phosphate dikinase n=1 Tax=Croceicoccus ponticola TaxID=2217664 RepID=A0A437GXW1_9SPHN|nr:pyruvate, phosphate dikinase [Croceicoccus ponticola]RVQ66066.1 pyruvate, phosphate dikinase [Croceicoccus ponticola]